MSSDTSRNIQSKAAHYVLLQSGAVAVSNKPDVRVVGKKATLLWRGRSKAETLRVAHRYAGGCNIAFRMHRAEMRPLLRHIWQCLPLSVQRDLER